MRVAIFTDHDLDKVSALTTALHAVSRHAPPLWTPRIYTAADTGVELPDYFSAPSLGVGLPWSRDVRIYWPRVRQFARALRRDGVDVIHITTPGPVGLVARWLAAHLHVPAVGSSHAHLGQCAEALTGSKRLGLLMNEYARWFYQPCRSLLVPSHASADLLTQAGHRRDRLRVWPSGVDADRFSPTRASALLRRRWGVDDRRPAILYAGRLSAEKGLALVSPLQRVLHRRGLEHRFVFVGDGPMAPWLRAECPDAVFTGAVTHDDVAVAMASADIFLFPSATDAVGDVVLESQASGIPAVVSDRGGSPEQLIDAVTGYVCRADDTGAFGARLIELLRSPVRRRVMGNAARLSARRRTWPAAVQPVCEAWQEALHGEVVVPRVAS